MKMTQSKVILTVLFSSFLFRTGVFAQETSTVAVDPQAVAHPADLLRHWTETRHDGFVVNNVVLDEGTPRDEVADFDGIIPDYVLKLAHKLQHHAFERRLELGDEKFTEELKKNRVNVNESGFGHAEMNTVDGEQFIRVVDDQTQFSYIFVPKEKIEPKSKHLKLIISRQHIDAGVSRTDGQKGRDVILVGLDGANHVSKIEFHPRFKKGSLAWLKDWARATYKKPTKGDVLLGVACGLTQAGLALCLSEAKVLMEPSATFDVAPAMLSLLYGTVIGAYCSTYRNWTYRGGRVAQTLKSAVVSLSFAYTLILIKANGGGAEALNIFDPHGLLQNADIIGNVIANNIGKVEWSQIPRIRTLMRWNTRDLEFRLPGVEEPVTVSQSSVENQLVYLIPFSLRLADLTHIKYTIPGMGYVVPLGKLLVWLSSIPARGLAVKYAESVGSDEAADLRRGWEKIKRFPVPQAQSVLSWAAQASQELVRGLTQFAQQSIQDLKISAKMAVENPAEFCRNLLR